MSNIIKKAFSLSLLTLLFSACLQSSESQQQGMVSEGTEAVSASETTTLDLKKSKK